MTQNQAPSNIPPAAPPPAPATSPPVPAAAPIRATAPARQTSPVRAPVREQSQQVSQSQNYKVLHHAVGPWPRGHVLSYQDFMDYSPDVDVERLLATEAIEPTDDDSSGPAPAGPENRQLLVDPTGRVLDAPGYDRPDVAARLGNRGREQARRETATRAGLNPGTLVEEGEPEEPEGGPDAVSDIRARPGVPFGTQPGDEYTNAKISDLRAEATGRRLPNAETMSKAALLNALRADDAKRA